MPEDASSLEALPWEGRAIILMDLDAFFASVEQMDHPGWRGKPVIVGGDPNRRGVVSTASYEARKFGVHSAMPSSTAARLCPDAIWTEGHYARYREVSRSVMAVLHDETPHVQQVSIDEAFADISPTKVNREHPVAVARRIQRRVEELGVTCSIGLGTTKAIAKLASDMDKPRGLTVVFPGSEASFMAPQPVRALSGIGPAAEAKLKSHGIETLGELAAADEELLVSLLGKNGSVMRSRARGEEDAPVEPDEGVKSVSNEVSFARDMTEEDDILAAIDTMAAKVGRRLRRKGLSGRTIQLKVRYEDLSSRTVQRPLGSLPGDDENAFMPLLHDMLRQLWQPGMALRLVGVGVTGFDDSDGVVPAQLSLFDEPDSGAITPGGTLTPGEAVPSDSDERRMRDLAEATDRVRGRFGDAAVSFGRELRTMNSTTGSSAKNPEDYK